MAYRELGIHWIRVALTDCMLNWHKKSPPIDSSKLHIMEITKCPPFTWGRCVGIQEDYKIRVCGWLGTSARSHTSTITREESHGAEAGSLIFPALHGRLLSQQVLTSPAQESPPIGSPLQCPSRWIKPTVTQSFIPLPASHVPPTLALWACGGWDRWDRPDPTYK